LTLVGPWQVVVAMLKVGSVLALIGSASGNIVSPGLDKCLQVHQDASQSQDALKALTTPINVELVNCGDADNQHYRIEKGLIKSQFLDDKCLTAETATANANVHLETCAAGSATQKWVMTHHGYIKLQNTDLCLDVLAEKKADGTRETFEEIKKNEVVNVQLYNCHNPLTTKRVNQLWTWAPGSYLGEIRTVVDSIDAALATSKTAVATAVSTAASTSASTAVTTAAPAATTVSGGAGAAASASMPSSVATAVAKQALTVKYLDESRATLSAKTAGWMVPAFVGVAVTSSVVALVGLHRWYTHQDPVSDDEAQALETELNHF